MGQNADIPKVISDSSVNHGLSDLPWKRSY